MNADNLAVPAFARRAADRYLLPAGPQQYAGKDGCTDLAPHTFRAVPKSQIIYSGGSDV